MKKNTKRVIVGATGLVMLQGGIASSAAAVPALSPVPSDGNKAVTARDQGVLIETEQAKKEYTKVANVKGEFAFDQMQLSPSDKVFSLFGTAATAVCATPSFALENPDVDGAANYYINIGGKLELAESIPLSALRKDGKLDTMKCSCGMSSSIVNAEVVGVPLSSIIEMSELDEDINAVTVRGADGYGVTLSLDKAMNGGGMLVYRVAGTDLDTTNGGPVQLWMPGAAASYFTRQVTDIEFLHADYEIPVKQPDEAQRAKISIQNTFEGVSFKKGDQITFEGYADDYDVPVAAVEFSMDGGQTWTTCATENTSTKKWVYWYFSIDAPEEGDYRMDVRCVTADGKVSALASSVDFTVTDGISETEKA